MNSEQPLHQQTSMEEYQVFILSAETSDDFDVNLHGLDSHTAKQVLEHALWQKYQKGDRLLKILHGKGTGRLQQTCEKALATHPLVEYWQNARLPHKIGAFIYAIMKEKPHSL